jgi:hypothetical protein
MANLRILEIDEIKTVTHVSFSHVAFWNARNVERKLAEFQVYYNAARGHASLEGHSRWPSQVGARRSRPI